jgi:hypothetical protein
MQANHTILQLDLYTLETRIQRRGTESYTEWDPVRIM